MAQFLYPLTLPNINRFPNYFTVRIRRKFAIIPSLKISRNLHCVAILPCELSTPPRGHVIGGCPEVRGGCPPPPPRGSADNSLAASHSISSTKQSSARQCWSALVCICLKTGGTRREQNLWGVIILRHNSATRMKFCPLTTPEPLGLGS